MVKEVVVTRYVTEDGEEFASKDEAIKYELQKELNYMSSGYELDPADLVEIVWDNKHRLYMLLGTLCSSMYEEAGK